MGTFYIDGRPVAFEPGDNVLKAALEAGVDVPYFCYHAALGSLGACRLCAVEVAPEKEGQTSRVVISCLQPAHEGLHVSVQADSAKREHQAVIEFLMTNHPHDCPVCDEGGECHLQNMTVACGPPYRRYQGRKRTFPNQNLGPLVWQDMDRCITCYRCVRFYQQYALGDDFGAMRSRNEVFFGRDQEGALESPFAGNLVEVCPTGTFTDKVFRRHYSRVWDLETAPSVCPHCSVGCNTLPGARHGTLRRVRSRFNAEINRWFLCDRGRYGHRYTENPDRPLSPRLDGREVELDVALDGAARRLEEAPGRIAGLGSVREDLEGNLALWALMSGLGGAFGAFGSPALEAASRLAAAAGSRIASLPDMEQADAVLVAGDLTGHAPMMDLAVRQVVRQGHLLFLLHAAPAGLSSLARHSMPVAPRDLPGALQRLATSLSEGGSAVGPGPVAEGLAAAKRPLVIGVVETLGADGVTALISLARALPGEAMLAFAQPGPNAFGVALLDGRSDDVLSAVEAGRVETLIVLGADPFGGDPGAGRWRQARQKVGQLIVLDCLSTATAKAADCFLPLATWPERTGTFVNYEGRAQSFRQVFGRQQPVPDAFGMLFDLARRTGVANALQSEVEARFGELLPKRPKPGEPGMAVAREAIERLAGAGTAPREPVAPAADAAWQAALFTWYGEDPLATFAPELASLTPLEGARVSTAEAQRSDISEGQELLLRGPGGEATLRVVLEDGMPAGTLALSRTSLATLGLLPGDELHWERA
jgi:NADH-quinone oxidoreductase subunit G